jgi:Family of unknown function (DUF6178)
MSKPDRRPDRRDIARDERQPLDRILDMPHLEHVIPRLKPELLHLVIQRYGLEDCGDLVALATAEQLGRVFDLDLWRAARPGEDERFDADRFGVWLEVLAQSGATQAARKLAGMDVELVTAGIAQHARVLDRAAVSSYTTTDGEVVAPAWANDGGPSCDVGGYVLVAKRTDSWDAIVDVLIALDVEHRDYFHRVMAGCRRLSDSPREIDGLNDLLADRDQSMFDLAIDRERRRDAQGFVTPAQARAFLQMSRQLSLGRGDMPAAHPIARAYFRALDETAVAGVDAGSAPGRLPGESDGAPAPDDVTAAVAAVVDALLAVGVVPQQPRALLGGSQDQTARFGRIHALMQFVHDRNAAAYSTRSEEIAFLANTIVAGCSVQGRPLTPQEASDAAVAVCNLGLENWPPHWLATPAFPDDFLLSQDLVGVFQVGWTVLHDDVGMHAAEQLIEVLKQVRCVDRTIQAGLDDLRIELTRDWKAGEPWRARKALDVMASLDMVAWAALLALIDECPVLHAGIGALRNPRTRAVAASDFEFIAENRQIAAVREFLQSLPEILSG